MTLEEAAYRLWKMYDEAPRGEKAIAPIVFGIRHSDEVKRYSASAIVRQSTIPGSYSVEVGYGSKLADHVVLRGDGWYLQYRD